MNGEKFHGVLPLGEEFADWFSIISITEYEIQNSHKIENLKIIMESKKEKKTTTCYRSVYIKGLTLIAADGK